MSLPAVAVSLTIMMGAAGQDVPVQGVSGEALPPPVIQSAPVSAPPLAVPLAEFSAGKAALASAGPVDSATMLASAPPAASTTASAPVPDAAASGTALAPDAPFIALDPPAQDAMEDDQSTIVVTAQPSTPGDPLEDINVESFKIVQSVDKAVIEPVAKVYNKGLPRPVRKGLRNFFSNLGEPVVFLAYLLQLKPGKAAETAGRFVVNSTLGIAGLIDVAKDKPFNLPYRPNGLANTLGYYGVGPGPYMYLPIVGPTTLRDIIGDTVDKMVLPFAVGKPFTKPEVVMPAAVLDAMGERAAFDERINQIRDEDDPYATYRDLYLKQRKAEIDALHGIETPDVVPVYGPGLRTPGGKNQPQDDAAQPVQEPQLQAEPQSEAPLDQEGRLAPQQGDMAQGQIGQAPGPAVSAPATPGLVVPTPVVPAPRVEQVSPSPAGEQAVPQIP